ncbi:hypothetical protein JKP88DRAFT_216134 [Tribonema minus]|uniref:Thioredoxin domain-containing protein n=1 Tax=Tribonema minus TaxID=303371 RepID=A0A836C9F2_9STRA|nr:hypothetical protein JKP88DRAFT_216134 [Tribonema minus]
MEIFEAAVEASHGDRLVIIKAYVPWCRACKAFDLKYRRLGLELEQQDAPASFYEIDVFAVKDVKQLLDIKVAPSVIMFINGEKVESFSCGPKRFDLVAVKVQERLRELTGGGDGAEGEDAFHMTPPEPEPAEREEQPDY